MLREGSDALSVEDVALVQIATKIGDLHGAAVCAVHFEIRHESPAACPQLRRLPPPLDLGSQGKQLVDALPRLQRACGLTLADVSTEVAVRYNLRALSCSGGLFSGCPSL